MKALFVALVKEPETGIILRGFILHSDKHGTKK